MMYVYGDNGKEVSMVEQRSPGQVANQTRGTAAYYNNKTKQFQIEDPANIQLYDLKTGQRPKATWPDLGGSPPKFPTLNQKRSNLQKQGKSSTERKGFVGGQ